MIVRVVGNIVKSPRRRRGFLTQNKQNTKVPSLNMEDKPMKYLPKPVIYSVLTALAGFAILLGSSYLKK